MTAVGGSLIKPCIVGTVARTTTHETKSLGYSIYYTLVNVGGWLGPVLASQVRVSLGIAQVLLGASLTSLVLFAGTLLFFREPDGVPEAERRTLGKVLRDAALVFGNGRFIGFLVIFTGFWVMFWQVYDLFPFYLRDVLKVERFELIASLESFSVIFLTFHMTRRPWIPFVLPRWQSAHSGTVRNVPDRRPGVLPSKMW